jgi:glycosyltransferase involved in cell wall biosynthesis
MALARNTVPAAVANERCLRILHVIDGIGVGGAELVLLRLVERLQAAGHHNVIASLVEPGPLAQRLVDAGAVVEGLGFARGRPLGPAALRLRTAFRRHRPNVVQGWMYHGNLAASVGSWMSGRTAPVVWSVHSALPPRPEFKWFTRLAIRLGAKLSGGAAAVVYVSASSAPQHERLGFRRDRRVVIPNGTDCERFRPNAAAEPWLRALLGVAANVPLVGLFARWDPVKDHANLFQAARHLLDEGSRLHLVLAGTGIEPGNAELAAALDAAGLQPHATLLGERGDIEALIAGLCVFVLPSASEAFPLVLGEAMAAGVPCIATDVGDCAWIIADTGLIVPPGDPAALAAGLRRLLGMDRERRRQLGIAARRRVLEQFSLREMAHRYEDLYRRLSRDAGLDAGGRAKEVGS